MVHYKRPPPQARPLAWTEVRFQQDQWKQWRIVSRSRDTTIGVLTGPPEELRDAVGIVARLVDGQPGITPEEALEACLAVKSFVVFIHRGLSATATDRRVIHGQPPQDGVGTGH